MPCETAQPRIENGRVMLTLDATQLRVLPQYAAKPPEPATMEGSGSSAPPR